MRRTWLQSLLDGQMEPTLARLEKVRRQNLLILMVTEVTLRNQSSWKPVQVLGRGQMLPVLP